jgi:hypothetical protein
VLGHSRDEVTQVYAERDLTLALKVAARIGRNEKSVAFPSIPCNSGAEKP